MRNSVLAQRQASVLAAKVLQSVVVYLDFLLHTSQELAAALFKGNGIKGFHIGPNGTHCILLFYIHSQAKAVLGDDFGQVGSF